MYEIPYGSRGFLKVPLVTTGAQDYKTGPTLAAGDAKIWTEDGILANIAAEHVAFTSGSEKPEVGDTLAGATSTQTAIVVAVIVTSGTWGAGTAAGSLFVEQVSGAFQAENLNISGGTANVMTIGSDFTAGLIAEIGGGIVAVPWTLAESQTRSGFFLLVDATGAEWEDQMVPFEVTGHPSASLPFRDIQTYDRAGAGNPTAVSSTTFTLPTTADTTNNNVYTALLAFEDGVGLEVYQGSYVASTRVFTPDPAPILTFTTGCTVIPIGFPKAKTTNPAEVVLTAASRAAVADDVLDEALSGHATAGTLGKAVADTETDATAILLDTGTTLPATLSTIAGYIDTEVAAILAAVDTEVGAIKTVTDALPDGGALTTLTSLVQAAAIGDATWDEVIEGPYTARQLLRLAAAALFAKASGLATTTAVFRDLADTKPRITATVDADGNRTALTLDAS